jgi:large subunit ribosomal protein L30
MARKVKSGGDGRRTVRVRLVRSPIGFERTQRQVVLGMGLRRLGSVTELVDSPETRGMINKVRHLVEVE